ncbi:sialidase [Chloropicon primus]|nr:sialidase [Chloropicon primus]
MPPRTATANIAILICCCLGSFILVYMSKSLYWKLDSYSDVQDVRTFQKADLLKGASRQKLGKLPKPRLKENREKMKKKKTKKKTANQKVEAANIQEEEVSINCSEYEWNQTNLHKGIQIFTEKQCDSYELLTKGRSLKQQRGIVRVDRRVELTGCPSGQSLDYDPSLDHVTAYCANQTDGVLYNLGRSGPYAASILGTHASNILEMMDGTLVLTSFYGEEGGRNVSIVFSKFDQEAGRWSPPNVVSGVKARSAQNPVLIADRSGKLVLLHTSQQADKGQGTSMIIKLAARAPFERWTKPKQVKFPGKEGPFVRHKMVLSEKKTWLLPVYYTPKGYRDIGEHYTEMLESKDAGETWTRKGVMSEKGENLAQASVIRLNGGQLLAFFRSRKENWLFSSFSYDDGATWTKAIQTQLPNNNCGVAATLLESGAIALVFNNQRDDRFRWPLTIALSYDDGFTWPYLRDIEDDDETQKLTTCPRCVFGKKAEYSYPSILQSKDGYIHITYTYKRSFIKHVKIGEEWCREGSTSGAFQGHELGQMPSLLFLLP